MSNYHVVWGYPVKGPADQPLLGDCPGFVEGFPTRHPEEEKRTELDDVKSLLFEI